jgi:hypothetical protein
MYQPKKWADLFAGPGLAFILSAICWVGPANADSFFFSAGLPDGRMASASRPDSPGKIEIESADDFVTTAPTTLTSATFTGLLTGGATIANVTGVTVEIYRVFPADSNVGRTSGPPTFSTTQVPTRVNSPSDVALFSRDSASGSLSFTPGVLSPNFTANNSVAPGGIHPSPGQTTGGNGAVTGQEVSFNVLFNVPIPLSTDHFFFVPQVDLSNGDFLWLSTPRPIVPPGTPFPAGFTDLQGWARDANLDPDWLRIGTDIVGGGTTAPTFNFTFTLSGETAVPLPGALPLFATGLAGLGLLGWRRKKAAAP